MKDSLWQHQSIELIPVPRSTNPELQAFGSGVLFALVLVTAIMLWGRTGRARRSRRRRAALVTGWGDLFGFLGTLVRGALFLVMGFLLLARVLFWPAGRRW